MINMAIVAVSAAVTLIFAMISSSKASQYTHVRQLIADSIADSIRFAMAVAITVLWHDWAVAIFTSISKTTFYSVFAMFVIMAGIILLEGFITLKNGAESLLRQNPISIS